MCELLGALLRCLRTLLLLFLTVLQYTIILFASFFFFFGGGVGWGGGGGSLLTTMGSVKFYRYFRRVVIFGTSYGISLKKLQLASLERLHANISGNKVKTYPQVELRSAKREWETGNKRTILRKLIKSYSESEKEGGGGGGWWCCW